MLKPERERKSKMEAKNVKPKVKKGFWKPEEDLVLKKYVETHGEGNWATLSKKSGLMRSAKSCRLRWKNYLRPNIKRGTMSEDEKDLIIRMHKLLGNRWSLIAGRLPGRTDNEIKNYWNTHLNKKLRPGKKMQTNSTSQKKNSLSIHQENAENNTGSAEDGAGNRVSDSSEFDMKNIICDIENSSLPAASDVAFFYSDESFMPILDDLVLLQAFDAEGLPMFSNL